LTLTTWFVLADREGIVFIMSDENQQSLKQSAPLLHEEEDPWERLDKVHEYIEFRKTSKECQEALSLKPGHMFHSWKCRHDQRRFMMVGVRGSQPHQQYQWFHRDIWTWTCTNCTKIQSGEDFPTEYDVDGCSGVPT
jgi:hypothetical protein